MKLLVIGLTSDAPGCGKSTAAFAIHACRDGWHTVPFAKTLKTMTRALLADIGMSEPEIIHHMNAGKQDIIDSLGTSARRVMQVLGTEVGRHISEDFWVRIWMKRILDLELVNAKGVIVDDVRFPNEAKAIKQVGGELWRIQRDSHIKLDVTHASEGSLRHFAVDRIIENSSSVRDFAAAVKTALHAAERRHLEALDLADVGGR